MEVDMSLQKQAYIYINMRSEKYNGMKFKESSLKQVLGGPRINHHKQYDYWIILNNNLKFKNL